LHGANDSRTHIAAISAPTDGPYKSSSKSKRKYKANSKYTKHRAHWVRQVRVNDDDGEEEVGAWLVIFMMVVAVMALAYLSSMLSGESGEYAMDVGGMGEDKVIGWGKADGQRKWHVKRTSFSIDSVHVCGEAGVDGTQLWQYVQVGMADDQARAKYSGGSTKLTLSTGRTAYTTTSIMTMPNLTMSSNSAVHQQISI
jgi:hypothetical protein